MSTEGIIAMIGLAIEIVKWVSHHVKHGKKTTVAEWVGKLDKECNVVLVQIGAKEKHKPVWLGEAQNAGEWFKTFSDDDKMLAVALSDLDEVSDILDKKDKKDAN